MSDVTLDDMAKFLLELADIADEGGLKAEADAIAAVLPGTKMLKAAQYEGFQHYWMMNGRAFERAWMLKRRQKPTMGGTPEEERKSAHETWFEVLEEYQKSLEGNQEDFLARYADSSAPVKTAKAPKEVEEAEGSSAEMGPGQKKLHKHIEDKAKEDGETEGEEWSEWLEDAEAGQYLFRMVTAKIAEGEKHGVAIYEAVDEMASGRELVEIRKRIEAAAEGAIKALAAKKHVKAQWLQNMWEKVKGLPGAAWGVAADAAGFSGPGMLNAINTQHQIAINNMKAIWSAAKSGAPIDPMQVERAVGKLKEAVDTFSASMTRAGMPRGPVFPSIADYARNVGGKSGVTAPDIQRWATDVDKVLAIVKNPDVAKTMERSRRGPPGRATPPTGPTMEDQYLAGKIKAIVGDLSLPAGIVPRVYTAVKSIMDAQVKQLVSSGGDELAMSVAIENLSNAAMTELYRAPMPAGYTKRHFDAARDQAKAGLIKVLKEVLQRKVQSYVP